MACGLLILCAFAAAGGYVAGHSGAADLDAARARGHEAGTRQAEQTAARKGYQQGVEAGQKAGYRATYKDSYKTAYRAKTRKLKKAAARQAAAAPQPATSSTPSNVPPGSTYTDGLPNGKPGYVLPPDQRSLGCVGIDAATGQCIGD